MFLYLSPMIIWLLLKGSVCVGAAFVNDVYRGRWESQLESQTGFVNSNSGKIAVFFSSSLEEEVDRSYLAFQLSQNGLFEENKLLVITNYTSTSLLGPKGVEGPAGKPKRSQAPLLGSNEAAGEMSPERPEFQESCVKEERFEEGVSGWNETKVEMEVSLITSVFETQDVKFCNATLRVRFSPCEVGSFGQGRPLGLGRVSGELDSPDCRVSFRFGATNKMPGMFGSSVFLAIASLAVGLGVLPFVSALRNPDQNTLSFCSDTVLLSNSMIDFTHVMLAMSFSLRLSVEHFQIFSALTVFLMMSVLIKIRASLQVFETKLARLSLSEAQTRRAKSFYLLKFILSNIFVVFASNSLIINYYLNHLLFLYPIVQILHNCFNVTRKNCYKPSIHPLIFLPQAVLPSMIRLFPQSVIPLRPDYLYSLFLLSQPIVFVWIMRLQKSLGPTFFLPKLISPSKFDYYLNLTNEIETENCPICFAELREQPSSSSPEQIEMINVCMETPCMHRFHVQCLETWMEQKLACPCCRSVIPPY